MKAMKAGFLGCLGVIGAITLVVVVIVVLVSMNGGDEPRVVGTPTEANASPTSASGTDGSSARGPHPVGTTVKVGDAEVTVLGFRIVEDHRSFPPDPGFQYLIVDAEVRNTGDDDYVLSTLLQFKVRDSENRTYSVDIFPDTQGSLDVQIAPGDAARGEVAFEVPIASAPYRVRFEQAVGFQYAEWLLQP